MSKKQLTPEEIQNEINIREQLLAQTDYKALKHSEGVISDEDYEPIKTERQTWRDEINELQKLLEEA